MRRSRNMLSRYLPMPQRLLMRNSKKQVNNYCRTGLQVRQIVFVAICSLSVLIFSTSDLRAEPHPWWLGARLGLSSSWIGGASTEEDIADYSNRMGFVVGALARLELTSWLSLQLEPSYVAKGARDELTTTGRQGETRLSYLTTPLVLRVHPYQHRLFTPYGTFGPEISFLLGCRRFVSGEDTGDCSELVKTIDFGAVAGLGVAVTLPWNAVITLEVQYDHALTSHFDREGFEADYKNRALLFSIGYSHRIGGADRR
jgi:Outer membrane protein beta-barrel domain